MKTSANRPRSITPVIVGAAAIIICAAGIAVLAFTLINIMQGPTWKDNANQPVHTVVQMENESDAEESYSPLRLVDTRGIELPDDCVTAGEAFATTTDIAESVFRTTPYGRAYAVLRTHYHIDPYYFDALGDLFWDVEMETTMGIVHTWINAYTGQDVQADYTYSSSISDDYWAFYDAWAESGSESEPSGRWGTIPDEQQRAATEEEPQCAYAGSSKERNIIQREHATALAADPASAAFAEEALRIVNTRNLGNGAEAVSAAVCLEGDRTYLVDVELSDGSYLVLHLFQESPSNVRAYERHNTSLVDLLYPL